MYIRTLLTIAVLVFAVGAEFGCASSDSIMRDDTATESADKLLALRTEIIAMSDEDQRLRRLVLSIDSHQGEDGKSMLTDRDANVKRSLADADRNHTERMKEIVDEFGWPTISLVGTDGSRAAWLLIQHATHDLEFMERVFSLMEPLVSTGEVSPKDFAYLYDRVQMLNDRPQRYGTQFFSLAINGVEHHGPWPMEDRDRVDELRRSVGLNSLAYYTKLMSSLSNDMPPIPEGMTIEEIHAMEDQDR